VNFRRFSFAKSGSLSDAAGTERNLAPARAQAELLVRQLYDFVEWKVIVEWE